jgi:hypothetical protein
MRKIKVKDLLDAFEKSHIIKVDKVEQISALDTIVTLKSGDIIGIEAPKSTKEIRYVDINNEEYIAYTPMLKGKIDLPHLVKAIENFLSKTKIKKMDLDHFKKQIEKIKNNHEKKEIEKLERAYIELTENKERIENIVEVDERGYPILDKYGLPTIKE